MAQKFTSTTCPRSPASDTSSPSSVETASAGAWESGAPTPSAAAACGPTRQARSASTAPHTSTSKPRLAVRF
ncbi:MAG TPA: hypothetical protein VF006_28360 [Longimicrobium sp.]